MLAVVSHDAGAAEILSSYVRREDLSPLFVLEGPALQVFERKLGPIEVTPLDHAIRRCSWILCGTSWQSELEFDAIKMARAHSKRSVAFLDHWVNYPERFVRSGEVSHPDEIWVGDVSAQALAARAFPEVPIRFVANAYFEDVRAEFARLSHSQLPAMEGLSVLYVAEPIRDHALRRYGDVRHFGYVEEEALRFFLANIAALGGRIGRIRIRPHPSEPRNKYEWIHNEFDLPIERGGSSSLIDEIAESDVVVGCESMAMVIGLLAGKRVISCIPPGGRACGLPHREIEHYQQLIVRRSGRPTHDDLTSSGRAPLDPSTNRTK